MKILTRKETAARLALSERTVDRLCQTDGGLKKIKLSLRRVGISDDSVSDYLLRSTKETAA
jgi:hypothetical protein